MTDRLTEQLTDIAEEIPDTDMYDRVMAGSRRLRHRRTLVAGFAALAVVVGLTGTAFAMLPDRPGSPPADSPDDAGTSDDEVIEGAANIPGTLVYLDVHGKSLTGYLHSDGRLVDRIPVDESFDSSDDTFLWTPVSDTFTVSTDDQYMAYVEFDSSLRVFDLGSDRAVPLTDPSTAEDLDVFCGQPSWNPTAARILYMVSSKNTASGSELRISDATTGELVDAVTDDRVCDYTWAADGESVVYGHYETRRYTVVPLDGGEPREFSVPGDDTEDPLDLVSVSADAGLACFSTAGFPYKDRALSCDLLVDTTTGELVDLPGWDGGALRTVRFLPDGGALVRATATDGTTTLHLIQDGREVAADLEPAEYADMELLDYHY